MIRTKYLILLLAYFSINLSAQKKIPELNKLSDIRLFNLQDTTSINLEGEWLGEEIQYDPTQSFIKVKFKVVFKLKQEGNRVYGSSYIEDKYRGSYGDMKIRGIIIGNTFHFEEYEILDEKFFEPGIVWCLRSGEMAVKENRNNRILEGIDYNGYASDNYSKCTDYAKMSIVQSGESNKTLRTQSVVQQNKPVSDTSIKVSVFPNPFSNDATLAYDLPGKTRVQIDIFTLSGAHIKTIFNEESIAGKHQIQFQLPEYAAGVYLIRLTSNSNIITKQIVKTR